MKEIKINILNTSRILFNTYGVSNVSIRQIAKELGISHSHLIYHFPTKQDIIVSLHQQLLDHAKNFNANFQSTSNFIKDLLVSTEVGFGILYEYKFLMLELNYILKENPTINFNPQKYFISIRKDKNLAFFILGRKKIRLVVLYSFDKTKEIIKENSIKELSEGVQKFWNGPSCAVIIENDSYLDEIKKLLKILISA